MGRPTGYYDEEEDEDYGDDDDEEDEDGELDPEATERMMKMMEEQEKLYFL